MLDPLGTPLKAPGGRPSPRRPEPARSPYKEATHSPSRQLLWELSQLRLSEERSFHARLDQDARKRESAHRAALAAAAAEHERIRQTAEAEREKADLQRQIDRQRERQRELEEVARKRQETVERELAAERELEKIEAAVAAEEAAAGKRRADLAAAEATRRTKEREEKEATETARRRRRKEEDEEQAAAEAKRISEERRAEQQAIEAAERARAAAAAAAKAQVPTPGAPTASSSSAQPEPRAPSSMTLQHAAAPFPQASSQKPVEGDVQGARREAVHRRYLEIHQNLKKLRKWIAEQAKQDPDLKKRMGEGRRSIRKCMGQLTGDKKANQTPRAEIQRVLTGSLDQRQPTTDVAMFLLSPPPPPAAGTDTRVPALLVYLLNVFAKALIAQFVNESAVSVKSADPIGIVGSSIFAQPELRWNEVPMVDVLIAKYHAVCPVLFGIHADEATAAGKRRLGWGRLRDSDGGFAGWVSDQRHQERMTGLGAGFAAMSLRNYERARIPSPYPTRHFWAAVAAITNVAGPAIVPTHCIVLKALIEHNEQRILDFFGDAGIVLLRRAAVEFPQRAPATSVEAKQLALVAVALQKERRLFL